MPGQNDPCLIDRVQFSFQIFWRGTRRILGQFAEGGRRGSVPLVPNDGHDKAVALACVQMPDSEAGTVGCVAPPVEQKVLLKFDINLNSQNGSILKGFTLVVSSIQLLFLRKLSKLRCTDVTSFCMQF